MEIKCPKCRFKYNEDVESGITEKACVCPRCGTPFLFKTNDAETGSNRQDANGSNNYEEEYNHVCHTQSNNHGSQETGITDELRQDIEPSTKMGNHSNDSYADLQKQLSTKNKLKEKTGKKRIDWKTVRRSMVIAAAAIFVLLSVVTHCVQKNYDDIDSKDDETTFVETNADNSTSIEEESKIIADENKWIEGSWYTESDKVEFTFSIRGNQISITDGLDQAVNGTYHIKGNTLSFEGYKFRLDKKNKCIWFDGIKFEESHFY